MRPIFQVKLASRRLVRTPSAFVPAKRFFFHAERKWKVIPAKSSCEDALSKVVSKMVTRMVRHYDQDERQTDAAHHWDTIRPVLLKACAQHGARDSSEKSWLRLIHEGNSKTRFEYCESSKNSLAYNRAIQGHSGGISNNLTLS